MALPTRVFRQDETESFDQAQRELNHMLGRFFGHPQTYEASRLAPYGVDVREDADHLYVEAELPGFKKDDVDIRLEDQTLTIAAERKVEDEYNGDRRGNGAAEGKADGNANDHKPDWLLRERRYTRFLRSFTLPPTIDGKTVDAKLQDGVLKITLNKRAETKPRRITVS